MRCPFCNYSELKVIDKRAASNDSIRRRRECLKCNKRFTTYERPEIIDLRVVKKSGERQLFNRNKILQGILKACEKRPVSIEQIEQAVKDIESELHKDDVKEVHSKVIGELVMEKLKKLDKVAYVRFASVYKDFEDVKSFEEIVKNLRKGD